MAKRKKEAMSQALKSRRRKSGLGPLIQKEDQRMTETINVIILIINFIN